MRITKKQSYTCTKLFVNLVNSLEGAAWSFLKSLSFLQKAFRVRLRIISQLHYLLVM